MLRQRCRAAAALDAIVWPGERRRHHFTRTECTGLDLQVGLLLDGYGGHCQVVFTEAGVIIVGFDPRSQQIPRRCGCAVGAVTAADVPEIVTDILIPPMLADGALGIAATYVLWRPRTRAQWHGRHLNHHTCSRAFGAGGPPSDAAGLAADVHGVLDVLTDAGALAYHRQAGRRGIHLQLDAVANMYAGQPLTKDLIAALCPGLRWADVKTDLAANGYDYFGHRTNGTAATPTVDSPV